MKIRHSEKTSQGQDRENTFVAYDDMGGLLGEAGVRVDMRSMLCPARPYHLQIDLDCEDEALDALVGAATTRARMLARQQPDTPARVFCECGISDEAKMRALESQGYVDDDGLIRMHRVLQRGPIVKPMPKNCVIVRDYLIDEAEGRYFLERYKAMFSIDVDETWLRQLKQKPNFARLLAVAPDGMAGELITWSEGYEGVVDSIQTPPHWQRKGVASYLLEQARNYWMDRGLTEARFDVWTRLSGAMRLAATSGFRPKQMIVRYPGMDIN